MDCVGCGSRWVNLLTEPVQFVMMTRLSWIDLPSACQSTIGLNVSCATVVANSRAQAAMRFPVLISLDFLFGGKRPPQTKPPVAYQSSAVQYTCSFAFSYAIATWHRGFGSASGLESGRVQH